MTVRTYAKRLRDAIEQTFTFRNTHGLPVAFPAPPPAWTTPYAVMARDDQLPWSTLDHVTQTVKVFLDPVLGSALNATWEPSSWTWRLR